MFSTIIIKSSHGKNLQAYNRLNTCARKGGQSPELASPS